LRCCPDVLLTMVVRQSPVRGGEKPPRGAAALAGRCRVGCCTRTCVDDRRRRELSGIRRVGSLCCTLFVAIGGSSRPPQVVRERGRACHVEAASLSGRRRRFGTVAGDRAVEEGKSGQIADQRFDEETRSVLIRSAARDGDAWIVASAAMSTAGPAIVRRIRRGAVGAHRGGLRVDDSCCARRRRSA